MKPSAHSESLKILEIPKTSDEEKRIQRASFHGDPNIGLFCSATDKYVVAPPNSKIELEVLRVPVIEVQVARTNLNGIFLVGNSSGLLAPWIIADNEMKKLEQAAKKLKFKVQKIETKHTALGNLIVCNDKGCIASPLLRDCFKEIKECLGVRVIEGKMMNLNIPGALVSATNKGFLLNMHAVARDLKFVEKSLGVEGDVGTVNFGSGFVKSGIVANSNGLLIGARSTGPEISRIIEALKFL